jgi:cell division protein FtsI (penicillin-binding protein 3)
VKRQDQDQINRTLMRKNVLLSIGFIGFCFLAAKLLVINTKGHENLVSRAEARHVRALDIQPLRGPIYDRNERLLAVSTPVDTLWAEPKVFCKQTDRWHSIDKLVAVDKKTLKAICKKRETDGFINDFMFVKRQISPADAAEVIELGIEGLNKRREYKRFYPTGPASGHVVGFTDRDGMGQEGIEKMYDQHLSGSAGKKTLHRDSRGRFVEYVEQLEAVENGQALTLTLDSRLQYLASAYLEEERRKHQAAAANAIVIHVPTGEILAMVDSPQFNPNDRRTLQPELFRNRAVTDVQEPGSTIKPFTVAMALESGRYSPSSTIDTGKGRFKIGGSTITDTHENGVLSLHDIVVKSSNIGVTKLSLEFDASLFHETLSKAGFGKMVGAVPAEVSGILPKRDKLIDRATQSYGYGLNATALQLARAYTVFANGGNLLPLSLVRDSTTAAKMPTPVFSKKTIEQMLPMLEEVVSVDGTARRAAVPRYRVGGKTGTTYKLLNNGYDKERYVSWFAGLAPISDPQFVMVVMMDDPRGKYHYGGQVAAPVFSRLMRDALRLYNVAPDQPGLIQGEPSNMALSKIALDKEAT